jgi:hypothetical protein
MRPTRRVLYPRLFYNDLVGALKWLEESAATDRPAA